MHGVYAEILLNYVERSESDLDVEDSTHSKYLGSKLEYDDSSGVLLDDKGAPVMMKWESEIMQCLSRSVTSYYRERTSFKYRVWNGDYRWISTGAEPRIACHHRSSSDSNSTNERSTMGQKTRSRGAYLPNFSYLIVDHSFKMARCY